MTTLMSAAPRVLSSYRLAFKRLRSLLVVHLAVRLAIVAILAPLISTVLVAAIGLSGRHAVTDQDIAWFLLTPAGAIGSLVAVSLAISAAILDVAVMMHTLGSREDRVIPILRDGLAFIFSHIHVLIRVSSGLLIRILGILLPFTLAMAVIAARSFREYDINFYLTHRPPEAVFSTVLILLLGVIAGVLLVLRLVGWLMVLPLAVTHGEKSASLFVRSTTIMQHHRMNHFWQLLIWIALRALLIASVAVAFGLAIGGIPLVGGENLKVIAALTLTLLLSWSICNACIVAVTNGALASMLLRTFREVTGQNISVSAANGADINRRTPIWAVLAAATVSILVGFQVAGGFLAQVTTPRDVEIIAHRGAAAERPENTMASVLKAIQDGADWVEIDVQETADGEIIVAHDSDFMKLAGVDLKIWDATLNDLARIDIGSWFDPAYAEERTATLREVLQAAKGKSHVMIELKYYGHDIDLENRVARIVEDEGMSDEVAVMSLKVQGVSKMRSIRPGWRTGILAAKAIGDISQFDTDFLAVNTGQVSRSLIRRSKSAGKDVYVWTVDDPVTMSRMISMGVDGLITNRPALAKRVMEQRNALSTSERLLLWLADRFGVGSFRLVAKESDA